MRGPMDDLTRAVDTRYADGIVFYFSIGKGLAS